MVILPEQGVGEVAFGTSPDIVEGLLGKPDSTESALDWTICRYDGAEISEAVFLRGSLLGIVVEPTNRTELWGHSLYLATPEDIKALLKSNGHACKFVPSPTRGVRDQVRATTAGLNFYLEDNRCDEICVNPTDWGDQYADWCSQWVAAHT